MTIELSPEAARELTTQRLLEISAALGSTAASGDIAHEVLNLLRMTLPFKAATLCAFSLATGTHRTVAQLGPTEFADLLAEPTAGGHRPDAVGCAVLWADRPHGLTATACLHSRDGRYTGTLQLLDPVSATPPAAVELLARLQPLLAGLADGLRLASQLAAAAHPDAHGAVLLADGAIVELPDRRCGPHLTTGSPLVRAVVGAGGALPERFRWRDGMGRWHAVQTRTIDDGVLVLELDEDLPHGLTARELDVLTLVAVGYTNPQIAELLVVSGKTVAKHVEHLFGKLGCTSRSAAAAVAVRLGLIELVTEVLRPGGWSRRDEAATRPDR